MKKREKIKTKNKRVVDPQRKPRTVSTMSTAEKNLTNHFQGLPRDIAPGFVIQAFVKGEKKIDLSWGSTYKYYDLASLTKVLATTSLVNELSLLEKTILSQPISKWTSLSKSNAKVKQLLNHTAGHIGWRDFYRKIPREYSPSLSWMEMKKLVRSEKLRHSRGVKAEWRPVYSDLDFIILADLIENYFEKPMDFLFKDYQDQWGLQEELFYLRTDKLIDKLTDSPKNSPKNFPPNFLKHKLHKYKKSNFAPTEECAWRGGKVQAEVHDRNTWAVGGVCGHAGLFGTVDGVAEMSLLFRKWYRGSDQRSKSFQRLFSNRVEDWHYGFMAPTLGGSSAGNFVSQKAFGHTGFTGTSLWVDPKKDVIVVMLSNRTYPSRENSLWAQWRPQIHDWVFDALECP